MISLASRKKQFWVYSHEAHWFNSPSPALCTPYHLHFSQGTFTKGYSKSRTCTAIIEAWFIGWWIRDPIANWSVSFWWLPQVPAAAQTQRQPRRWPPCTSGSLRHPHLPAGLPLAILGLGSLLSPDAPAELGEQRSWGDKRKCQGAICKSGKSHGKSAWLGGITETVLDMEAVGSWGPQAAYERNPPLTCICMACQIT